MSEFYTFEPKKFRNGDTEYDSELEYKYKVLFEQSGIKAIYHPATFHTGKYWSDRTEITYTPDFYICDENVFCEVKPRDEMLKNPTFQQKISAAMDHNATPIGHGLLILGDMEGFTPDQRQGSKKIFLYGEMYTWEIESIKKGYWGLGADKEDAEVHFFYKDRTEYDDFPCYPRFAKNPKAKLHRSYNDSCASKILWSALCSAMYAIKNLEKTTEKETNYGN